MDIDERMRDIEKEVAVISSSIVSIVKTLEKISECQMENKVLLEKFSSLERRVNNMEAELDVNHGVSKDAGCEALRRQDVRMKVAEVKLDEVINDKKKLSFLLIATVLSGIASVIFNVKG